MNKRKNDGFKTFGSSIRAIYSAHNWRSQWELFLLHDKWSEIAGKKIAKMTSPAFFRNTTLYVFVENSAWMQQVHFETRKLQQQINGVLEEKQIDAIRLLLRPTELHGMSHEKIIPEDKQVDQNVCHKMKQLVEYVEDEDCRDALYNLWHRSKVRSRNT